MPIEEQIPLLEQIMGDWQDELGDDYPRYKNHVYRVVNFCLALHNCGHEEREKIIIAGCFHDLGIWSNVTLDYLPPSIALATDYLRQRNREKWIPEIALMIDMHHKVGKYADPNYPLVEAFRRADLVDVSLGIVKYDLAEEFVNNVKASFPNVGFHKRLVQLAVGWLFKHPFRPAPFVKW